MGDEWLLLAGADPLPAGWNLAAGRLLRFGVGGHSAFSQRPARQGFPAGVPQTRQMTAEQSPQTSKRIVDGGGRTVGTRDCWSRWRDVGLVVGRTSDESVARRLGGVPEGGDEGEICGGAELL